jgi:hypothetical protein
VKNLCSMRTLCELRADAPSGDFVLSAGAAEPELRLVRNAVH